jgi:hypothetical protein
VFPGKDFSLAIYYGGMPHPVAVSADGVAWNWLNISALDHAVRAGIIKRP